jgi:ribonuclease BN (tRNA processing enzyme)
MHTSLFTITTLGTGAALPARGRFPTSQLVNIHDNYYLVDCGEGTQERLRAVASTSNGSVTSSSATCTAIITSVCWA